MARSILAILVACHCITMAPALGFAADKPDLFAVGRTAADEGDHIAAVQAYSDALKTDGLQYAPELKASILQHRAMSFMELMRFDEMLADAEASIYLGHKDARNYYLVGSGRLYKGDFDRAIESLTTALDLHPSFIQANRERGTAYAKKNNLDLAIRDFQVVLSEYPYDVKTNFNIGIALHRRGDPRAAIKHFDTAIDSAPTSAVLYAARAQSRQAIGLDKAALRDIEQAIRLGLDPARPMGNLSPWDDHSR